jgi:hypothetical protein
MTAEVVAYPVKRVSKVSVLESVWPAWLASKFARELGLPFGNMWEPGIAAHIARDRDEGHSPAEIEAAYRLRLGL